MCVLSHVQLFAALWTVAYQAPLSMEFSGQEYWSGLPFLIPGDLPDWGIEPSSIASPALAGGFFITEAPGKPQNGWLLKYRSSYFFRPHIVCLTTGRLCFVQFRYDTCKASIWSIRLFTLRKKEMRLVWPNLFSVNPC